jgi:outer membrane protein assembly factor BamA
MNTSPDAFAVTKPLRLDVNAGASVPLRRGLELGVHALFTQLSDDGAADIVALDPQEARRLNGSTAGIRVELVHDDRDNPYATRYGGRRVLWTETYGLQADHGAWRQRTGLTLTQFFPLRAPDFVLALRGEAAFSNGERAYVTDFALGGADFLRGYYSNRFRGDIYAAATAEVRFPIVWYFSGAAFGEMGRVWASDTAGGPLVAYAGGAGIRFGLPPDRLVRLRFDVAFSPDQWGLFFKFNESF